MKDFEEVAFDCAQCKKELDRFRDLLASKHVLSERDDLQPLFKESPHLTAYLGTTIGLNIGIAKQLAYEFELLGDFSTDIVLGKREKHFCFVELEDGDPASVLKRAGNKSTKEWGRRFEHGFSQIVDWFYLLDDLSANHRLFNPSIISSSVIIASPLASMRSKAD